MVALRLKLDNMINLPDGGPTSLEVQGRRSVDIGRNTYLDWTLPDPSRVVSGRHCEIQYRDGGYWLTDVSTNGTFLNGSDTRLTEPTRLRSGDRIAIGDYLVNVTVEEDGDASSARVVEAPPAGPAEAASGNLWEVPGERAAPAERADARKARAAKPVHADVLDWISDLPTPEQPAAPVPPQAPARPAAEPPASPTAKQTTSDDLWGAPAPEAPAARAPQAPEEAAPPPAEPPAAEPDVEEPDRTASEPAAAAEEADAPEAEAPVASAADDDAVWENPPAPPIPPEEETPVASTADDDALWDSPPGPPAPPEDVAPPRAPEPVAAPVPDDLPPPPAMQEERGFGPAVRAGEPQPGGHGAEFERFAVALAAALDVPRERLDTRSPEDFANRIGAFLNLTIAGMQRLLKARAASRGYMRSGPGTQVQAVGNNPLKFMPTPGAAADVLFGARSRSYLGIEETLDESFADLGAHQMALYAAMQGAVERMLKDLDPAAIEAHDGEEKGFALPGSRKGRHWDTYKERYNSRASQHDNGMVDVFMMCFADAYARAIDNRD